MCCWMQLIKSQEELGDMTQHRSTKSFLHKIRNKKNEREEGRLVTREMKHYQSTEYLSQYLIHVDQDLSHFLLLSNIFSLHFLISFLFSWWHFYFSETLWCYVTNTSLDRRGLRTRSTNSPYGEVTQLTTGSFYHNTLFCNI